MTLAPASSGVLALDRLSHQLVRAGRAGGLRVALADSPEEHETIHRLRHRQVIGHGWAAARDLPEGIERDGHDERSLQVGAWARETLVGGMRLVLPAPGRRLPVEEAFELDIEPRGALVEAGRLVIAPEYRGDPAHRAWGALFGHAWLALRDRGFSLLCGAASPVMVQRLRALGLPFEVLGPSRTHWGEERFPVSLDPAGGDPRWFRPAR